MMDYEEALEFSLHPVKASDIRYTPGDTTTFDYLFSEFKSFLISELNTIIRDIESDVVDPESFEIRKRISNLKTMWYDCHKKCANFAYHTGINLIPNNKYNL